MSLDDAYMNTLIITYESVLHSAFPGIADYIDLFGFLSGVMEDLVSNEILTLDDDLRLEYTLIYYACGVFSLARELVQRNELQLDQLQERLADDFFEDDIFQRSEHLFELFDIDSEYHGDLVFYYLKRAAAKSKSVDDLLLECQDILDETVSEFNHMDIVPKSQYLAISTNVADNRVPILLQQYLDKYAHNASHPEDRAGMYLLKKDADGGLAVNIPEEEIPWTITYYKILGSVYYNLPSGLRTTEMLPIIRTLATRVFKEFRYPN